MSSDKNWTRDEIEEKMKKENRWLIGGLLAIYERQTETEKRTKSANVRNNVGFNKADADFLTSVAKQAQETKNRRGTPHLTETQINYLRWGDADGLGDDESVEDKDAEGTLMKYAQQLADIANGDR